MKIQNKLAALLLVVALMSCAEPKQGSNVEADIQKQEEEIKAALVDMWDAIEKEDIDRYAAYIHPDFTQFGEFDPVLRVGKEVEVKATHEWIKNSSDIHTEMVEPLVTVKGDVAWITYYWEDHGITGGEEFASRGKSTRIFVKEQGKWLCIHGHYTILP